MNIELDGKVLDIPEKAYIENDRTMMPVRVISEELGYNVTWDEPNQKVLVEKTYEDGMVYVFELTIGSNVIVEDSSSLFKPMEKEIEVPPVIKNERTFIPVRALTELLGLKVDWNENTRTVKLTTIDE